MVCGGISAVAMADADAPPPAIARDTPASPNTGTALLRRFSFEARFACGIAAFLLHIHSRKCCAMCRKRNTLRGGWIPPGGGGSCALGGAATCVGNNDD